MRYLVQKKVYLRNIFKLIAEAFLQMKDPVDVYINETDLELVLRDKNYDFIK